MTLNSVDLPQPDGPITDKNSPGLTLNETSSTAMIGAFRRVEAHDDVVAPSRMASLGAHGRHGSVAFASSSTAVMAAV